MQQSLIMQNFDYLKEISHSALAFSKLKHFAFWKLKINESYGIFTSLLQFYQS